LVASPTTIIACILQQMTLTLIEIGQKIVDPPMIAVGDAIQGGTNLYAGAINWVDPDYDERTSEVLRPITLNGEGLQWRTEYVDEIERVLNDSHHSLFRVKCRASSFAPPFRKTCRFSLASRCLIAFGRSRRCCRQWTKALTRTAMIHQRAPRLAGAKTFRRSSALAGWRSRPRGRRGPSFSRRRRRSGIPFHFTAPG
jgi:hypothetical protein